MTESYDKEIFQSFLDETLDSVEALGSEIIGLESAPNPKKLVEGIFRPVHGIKGNSGFFGLTNLQSVSHKLEDLLQDILADKLTITRDLIDILVQGVEILVHMVNTIRKDPTATTLSAEDHAYVEKIVEFRSREVAAFELTYMLQKLTTILSELNSKEIDPNHLPSSHHLLEATNRFINDSRKALDLKEENILQTQTVYLLNGEDVSEPARILVDSMNSLKMKSGVSSQRAESFKSSFYEIHDRLSLDQQEEMAIHKVKNLFEFLDDGVLNQEDDFIKEIDKIVANLMVYLQKDALAGKEMKIGEILLDSGKVNEKDISDALSKQKPLGRILVEDNKINEKDLAEALTLQSRQAMEGMENRGDMVKTVKTIRIQQGKVDEFAFRVGELTMNLDALSYIQNQLARKHTGDQNVRDLKGLAATLNETAVDLEKSIMEIRKLPARTTLQKIPPLVRTLSQNMGKSIRTEIIGEDVLVDKDVLEKLGDPIVHLIRNSVDHGIEKNPEERTGKGKNETALIKVEARTGKSHFYLDISDDGKGIDPDKIRRIATEKNILPPHEISRMNNQDVFSLIFRSGFSSAEKVSDISGRGVGLDVVKQNIEDLGGTVTLDSELNKGTAFHLKIPLTQTLMTKDVLFITEGGKTFALPSFYIDRIISIKPDEFKKHKDMLIASVNDKIYSFKKLDRYFNHNNRNGNGHPLENLCGLLFKNKNAGILVDNILSFNKVVILEDDKGYFKDAPLLDGFTIKGDGQVVMLVKLEQVISDLEV